MRQGAMSLRFNKNKNKIIKENKRISQNQAIKKIRVKLLKLRNS
jgi:hypothetical protein